MSVIKKSDSTKTVAVVGTGISGLMDAFALHHAGFIVSVYTKGSDPRKNPSTEQYSSTRNGLIGRFVSRFEGEHYLSDSPMYPDMKGAFQKHVTEGGWLGKFENELDAFDKQWLKKRYAACDDQKGMQKTERFYIKANGEAMRLWQKMILEFPELFKDADLLNTGILRLYDNALLFEWAVKRHEKGGVLEKALSAKDIAQIYPYFSDAVQKTYIAGGVEAPGFSFNIHKFTDNIIAHLEKEGVIFNWDQEILGINFSADKLVESLAVKNGSIKAKHYVINPGAYADETLFIGTSAKNKIAGVAGRWMLMPSPKNFKRPVKIHGDVRVEQGKKFPVVDINLTYFKDEDGLEWLAVGGGYAYLGKPPFKTEGSAFDLIDAENERTVKRYLGSAYEEAAKSKLIIKTSATCVRSFTYDDVPIMDNIPTINRGLLRINSGTNTGTTTISTFTAQETVRALNKI